MVSSPRNALFVVALTAAGLAGLAPACLERHDDDSTSEAHQCASCHGDEERAGSPLERSAPPMDLAGNTNTSAPGVGAHQWHVGASDTHAPVACSECHVVPEDTRDPGHADSPRPAELSFGSLASQGDRAPGYDASGHRCSDTYCHRDADAVWNQPRSSEEACGTCHGLPPAPPHPQSTQCQLCHADVVDENMAFVGPELHVNGEVDIVEGACNLCHGSQDNSAPPTDLAGNTDPSAIGVGAHQAHLAGGTNTRPVECSACHQVPENVRDPGHLDGAPADLVFSGVATAGDKAPSWDRDALTCADSWCHSPGADPNPSPEWTSNPGGLGCTGCHSLPPVPPHPQMSNCAFCHGAVVDQSLTILDRNLHVNGEVNVDLPTGCTDCHGTAGQNAAPPTDVAGNTDPSLASIGAHQSHLNPSGPFRPVQCGDCHLVPNEVLDPGHVDSDRPAELTFGGVAVSQNATPDYNGTTCTATYCHGADFGAFRASGGTLTEPAWTVLDGSQVYCGSCHSLPPPDPHPFNANCSACHSNIAPDRTFLAPEQHLDGRITF